MNKLSSRLAVLILTVAFGTVATFLLLRYFPSVESYEKINFEQIPSIEYCDLRNEPRRFDGKIVRINANLNFFTHGFYFYDQRCSDNTDVSRTAVSIYQDNYKELENLRIKHKESGKSWQPLNITVIGRFTYKNFTGSSDHIEDRTHLQFEIYKIEQQVER